MFPIKSYFPFFGGLHIEQALLRIHGQLIKGSGIDDIIGMAGLPTAGLQTTVCDVKSIKKARYTLQIIAPCLLLARDKSPTKYLI